MNLRFLPKSTRVTDSGALQDRCWMWDTVVLVLNVNAEKFKEARNKHWIICAQLWSNQCKHTTSTDPTEGCVPCWWPDRQPEWPCSVLGGFSSSRARWWSLRRLLWGTSPSDRRTGGSPHTNLQMTEKKRGAGARGETGEDWRFLCCSCDKVKKKKINKLLNKNVVDWGRVKGGNMPAIQNHVSRTRLFVFKFEAFLTFTSSISTTNKCSKK